MKILYVACNPEGKPSLLLEKEITALQRRSSAALGDVEFVFFPHQYVEYLPEELGKHKPDIVHFSAHGDDNRLVMSNEAGASINLTADLISNFFSHEKPPQLIYLNACNSTTIASELVRSLAPIAIGTTAPITNRAARASAVLFYDRLIDGASVQQAFDASKSMVGALQSQQASMEMFHQPGVAASSIRLHHNPRIIARFVNSARADARGKYHVEFGVMGCPANTTQFIFFTDDKGFLSDGVDSDDEEELAQELCRVVRDVPNRSRIWSTTVWDTESDFRIACCGLSAGGKVFAVVSSLCDALKAYYTDIKSLPPGGVEEKSIAAIQAWDGDTLDRKGQRPRQSDATAQPRRKGASRKVKKKVKRKK